MNHLNFGFTPYIPEEEKIAERVACFATLRADIECQEENIIVRQLYLDAIDERINELRMIAAAGRQDDGAFWTYSQRLFALLLTPVNFAPA